MKVDFAILTLTEVKSCPFTGIVKVERSYAMLSAMDATISPDGYSTFWNN
jgi:hypothetical protein